MRIIWLECQKTLQSPLFVSLIALFLAFNVFVIVSDSSFKGELKAANELAATYGVQITDEALLQLERDLEQARIDGLDENDELLQQLKRWYYETAADLDKQAYAVDWSAIADAQAGKYGLSGKPEALLKREYAKLSERFEAMKESGELNTWFFQGIPYQMHSFLFRSVFMPLIFEALILLVLVTALLTNYEYENRTQLVAYAAKRGRRLMLDKLAASLIMTSIMFAMLFVPTLAVYFAVFDYTHLWSSSISTMLGWEFIPYVSWMPLTFAEFLALNVVIVWICMLLLAALTFAVATWLKNSYYTFAVVVIGFAMVVLLPGFVPASSSLILILGFTIAALLMNPHLLLMGSAGLTMFQYYEATTIGAGTGVIGLLCWISYARFKKQDIH